MNTDARSDFEGDPLAFDPTKMQGWSEVPFDPDNPPFPEERPTLLNAQSEEFDSKIFEDVQGLIYLGELTQGFDLYGHSFRIKTLRAGERLICAMMIREWEETLGLEVAFKMAYIAASIVEVDGRPFV